MDYDPRNKGVLFDEAEVKSDKHPIKTGKLNVEGKEYRIAAWEKTSKDGQSTFLSLAISEPKAQTQREMVAEVLEGEFSLKDIPF